MQNKLYGWGKNREGLLGGINNKQDIIYEPVRILIDVIEDEEK